MLMTMITIVVMRMIIIIIILITNIIISDNDDDNDNDNNNAITMIMMLMMKTISLMIMMIMIMQHMFINCTLQYIQWHVIHPMQCAHSFLSSAIEITVKDVGTPSWSWSVVKCNRTQIGRINLGICCMPQLVAQSKTTTWRQTMTGELMAP